jgi:2-polyprenyl-6-methoxyphenol hydroxylase-like FAD-dependent oxidoreductase
MPRVLIVGGGIGGLATAAALHLNGFDIAVFEQAPDLREAGAGVGLWSNSMASLDLLAAGPTVRQTCNPLRKVAGANPQGKDLTLIDLDRLGPEFASAACYVALRPALLAALAACVPHAAIHTNSRAVKIESLPNRICLHLENGSIEEGDLLIGADGLHSLVRTLVVGPDALRYSGQTAFRGIARIPPPDPTVLREIQGPGQRGAVLPVNSNTVYWWAALNAPAGKILPPEQRKPFLLDRFKGWPYGLPDAIEQTPPESILHNDLVDRPPAWVYAKGRLALIGDAAHPTTPNLGQGANMAIDDAIVLARCLRTSPSIPQALEQYQRERLPRTRLVVQRSWNFGQVCLWRSPIAIKLREASLRLTPKPVLKNILRWQILENAGTL